MKTNKLQKILSIFLNLLIIYWEIFYALPDSWLGVQEQMFTFYTENSNIFAMGACLLMAIAQLVALFTGREVPRWIKMYKYMASCCLMLTFLTVVFLLAPIYGPDGHYVMLLTGSMLYHHFLNPVVCFFSFVFLERAPALPRKAPRYALLPTLAYGAPVLALSIAGIMHGPYFFFYVYEQPLWQSALWFVLIFGGNYLIALAIWRLNGGKRVRAAK